MAGGRTAATHEHPKGASCLSGVIPKGIDWQVEISAASALPGLGAAGIIQTQAGAAAPKAQLEGAGAAQLPKTLALSSWEAQGPLIFIIKA